MPNKRIKLVDIAKQLNVTKVTVSKALRNHPDISEEMKNLVRSKAKELGYIPNIAARNLSSNRTNTIGVIIPAISNYFFANVVEALYEEAYAKNYEMILAVSQEDSEKERKHIESMLAMKVDGIIISVVQNSNNANFIRNVKSMNVPIVFFDRTLKISGISSVTSDNEVGAYNAVKAAVSQGYKKIYHFSGKDKSNISIERLTGYRNALKDLGIKEKSNWVVPCGYSKAEGNQTFIRLYESGNFPECIFTVTFPAALGVYEAATKLGVKIPDDLALICFGNSEINDYLSKGITCIDQSPKELGHKSIQITLDAIKSGREYKPQHFKVESSLVIKSTCC